MNLSAPYELTTWRAGSPSSPADEQLDARIRHLLSACHMPTPILSLAYQCEPSFRRALACQGGEHYLVYARDRAADELNSLGIRSLRTSSLNQVACRMAYIHHLRIHPQQAGGTLLARGYQAFREVSREFPAPITTTSILEGNTTARGLLENRAGRGPLPAYEPLTRYLTALLPLRGPGARWPRRMRTRNVSPYVIRNLASEDQTAVSDLYERASRSFDGLVLPIIVNHHSDAGLWPGLNWSDMLGVFAGRDLLGLIAVWNRMPVQQIRLSHLHPVLTFLQRFWSVGRAFWGECPLPPSGTEVPHLLLDPWLIAPGREREIGPLLLDAALTRAAARHALFVAFGVPEWHPMREVIRRFFHVPYWSMLYTVRWPETPAVPTGVEKRLIPPLGTL